MYSCQNKKASKSGMAKVGYGLQQLIHFVSPRHPTQQNNENTFSNLKKIYIY